MKWIIRIIIVLVLLIGAALWYGWSQLGNLVKYGIEQGTPPIVQTAVTVDQVLLSPMSGSGVIEGFAIGNPTGYSALPAVRLGRAELALDTGSVNRDKIVIKYIRITAPEFNLEAGLGGTNLKQIAKNAQSYVAQQDKGAPTPATPAASSPPKRAVKLQVNEFLITGAKLSASAAGLLPGVDAKATLPDIRLVNLGTGVDGITPAELIAEVLNQISTEAIKASAGGTLKNLLQGGEVKLNTGALEDGMKKLFGK